MMSPSRSSQSREAVERQGDYFGTEQLAVYSYNPIVRVEPALQTARLEFPHIYTSWGGITFPLEVWPRETQIDILQNLIKMYAAGEFE